MRFHFLLFRRMTSCNFQGTYAIAHGLRTPNQDINQRNLKIWADVADKICFGRTLKFGSGS